MKPKNNLASLLIAGLLTVSGIGLANAAEPNLYIKAIDAADGKASGYLQGQARDMFVQTTKSNEPVEVEISTIKRYHQAGCSPRNTD